MNTVESSLTDVTSNTAPEGYTGQGDKITAATFVTMVNLIDNLLSHNHVFTDTYVTNCQCDCGRGSL